MTAAKFPVRPPAAETSKVLPIAFVLGLIAVGLGAYVYRDLGFVRDESHRSTRMLSRGLDLVQRLQFYTLETRRQVLYALGTTDANEHVVFAQRSRAASDEVDGLLADEDTVAAIPGAAPALDRLRVAWRAYLPIRDEVIGHALEAQVAEASALDLGAGAASFQEVERCLEQLVVTFQEQAATHVENVAQQTRQVLIRVGALWVAALLGIMAALLLLQRRLAIDRVVREESRRIELLEVILDAVVGTDESGRIVTANTGAERLLGVTKGALHGRPLSDFLGLADASRRDESVPAALATACRDAPGGSIEAPGRRADGQPIALEVRMIRHLVDDGVRYTAHLRDISLRRRAEDQLRESARAAREATDAKSRFVATISHEIRTPLNAILGMTTLLGASPLTPEQRAWVTAGRYSGEALLSLIAGALDLSRIEAGQFQLEPQPTDLYALAGEVLAVARLNAVGKNLQVDLAIALHTPRGVVFDSSRVRQVLLNLLNNAVKFTPAGSVLLSVSAVDFPGRESPADVQVRFEVKDTGTGVSPEDLTTIFDTYRQGGTDPAQRSSGSGLGLAISRQLAALLGGSLTAVSELGTGTTFTFTCRARTFALADEDLEIADLQSPDRPGAGDESAAGDIPEATLAARHPLRILLVEDDTSNRAMMTDTLRQFGYAPDAVGDGDAAVRAAAEEQYDLVLMDLQLPILDGVTAAVRILAQAAGKLPRVVAFTANSGAADRDRCLSVGMADVLVKPVPLRALRDALLATPGRPMPPATNCAPGFPAAISCES